MALSCFLGGMQKFFMNGCRRMEFTPPPKIHKIDILKVFLKTKCFVWKTNNHAGLVGGFIHRYVAYL